MIFLGWSRARFRPWLTAVGSAALFVGAVCLGDDIANRELLETLPVDRRTSLAENLERFDRLSGQEQTAVRRLDKTIEKMEDPIEQARYRVLLHHYHLWFQGLPEEQRTRLLGITNLDERFQAARQLRLAEASGPNRDGPQVGGLRPGYLGLIAPYEMGFLLKVWFALAPEERAEFDKKPPTKVGEALKAKAREHKIRSESFAADLEKTYDEQLEKSAEYKPLLEPIFPRFEPVNRKPEAIKKAENVQKKLKHPYAEFLYFEEKRPKVVDPALLDRFAESCPEWLHATTDPLSTDAARAYYTILYRQVYPPPLEMPEPAKSTKSGPASAPKKANSGNTDANAPTF